MTFDLEEDFENERWRLLALVDCRKSLSDGSEGAIKTDLEIFATRELIRTYETLKGYWSQKAFPQRTQRPVVVARLNSSGFRPRSASERASAEKHYRRDRHSLDAHDYGAPSSRAAWMTIPS
jgi:hypothetical protein